MKKPFNLPSIAELAIAYHNDILMYQKELDRLEATKQSVYDIFRCEELRRKIKHCEDMLEKYKPEIREEKLNELGI
jgi:hypothetical protein